MNINISKKKKPASNDIFKPYTEINSISDIPDYIGNKNIRCSDNKILKNKKYKLSLKQKKAMKEILRHILYYFLKLVQISSIFNPISLLVSIVGWFVENLKNDKVN